MPKRFPASLSRRTTVAVPSFTSTATFPGIGRASCPFFPVTVSTPFAASTLTPAGRTTGLLPILDIVSLLVGKNPEAAYQISQSSSPPIESFFAFSPVMTPRDVETMATPNPFFTVGISSFPT